MPPGPQQYDPNAFGTVEFVRFCRLAGAQPYLAANLRSLPPRDFYQWVEFCNSPAGTTTMADARAAQGEKDPLNVRYWGVGNEPWGCGGDFSPEDYAAEFRRFTSWVPGFDLGLRFIGAGPSGPEFEWTRRFFAKLTEESKGLVRRMWGWSVHHYSTNVSGGRSNDWNESKGPATGFTREQWFELLKEGDRLDGFIDGHAQVLNQFDPQRRVKLAIDEWGSWHKPGSEAVPSHTLGQVSTLRDALLAGLSLDIFHRHADRVGMANIAQLVNCLQALFVAHEDKFVVTPNYHVFDMYKAHMGAEVGADGVLGAQRRLRSQRPAGADLGAQRVGVAQGQDGDADGGEPESRHAARVRDRRRRRAHRVVHDAHADGLDAGRAQQLCRAQRRSVAALGEPDGAERWARADLPESLGHGGDADAGVAAGVRECDDWRTGAMTRRHDEQTKKSR